MGPEKGFFGDVEGVLGVPAGWFFGIRRLKVIVN